MQYQSGKLIIAQEEMSYNIDEDDTNNNIKENEIGYNNNNNNNNNNINSSILTTQNENEDSFGYKLESLNHSSKLIEKIDEKQLEQQLKQIQMADEKVKSRDWGNIWIVFLVLFLSESARGLVLPTISLYVLYVGGGSTFLGLVISSFSAGRFVSTVLLGYLSSKFQYKKVFLSAVFICIIGSVLYCFAFLDIGYTGKTLLVISRILLGFGAGTLSCVRAYISEVSTNEERTSYLAWASAIQFLGFSITPIIGSTLAYVPMFYIEGPVKVGLLTLPGWTLLISNVGLILILLFRFSNPPTKQQETIKDIEKQDMKQPILKSEQPKQSVFTLIKNDKQVLKTLTVFILLNFFVRGILGILETLGTPIYTLLNDDIDNTSGYFFGCMGIIGIVVLFGLSFISKNKLIDDFWVLVIGNTIIAFGCAICISREMNWGRFIVGSIFIWGFGYPLAQTVIVSMFSKSIPDSVKGHLGTFMGIIGGAGSLGRIIGPLLSGTMFTNTRDSLVVFLFAFLLSLLTFSISFLIIPTQCKEKIYLFLSLIKSKYYKLII